MQPTSYVAAIVAGVVTLLLIATVMRAVTRWLKRPFSVVLVLVVGLAALSTAYPRLFAVLHDLEISSARIFYVLATIKAGEFVGETALLSDRQPRNATVTAVTPCMLYRLHRDDLKVAMETHPAIRTVLEEESQKRTATHHSG
jgi:CRP-like cAMP-binding protein